MVEVNDPRLRQFVLRQIESQELENRRQEQEAAVQNEIRRLEREIVAERRFHSRLPERMAVTDDRMPSDKIINSLRLPSDENTRYLRLPNDSHTRNLKLVVTDSMFAADMNNFFNGMLGGNQKRKRK